MRLREVQDILRINLPLVKAIRFEAMSLPGGQHATRLHNWRAARPALDELCKVRALREAEACRRGPWDQLAYDPAMVNDVLAPVLLESVKQLVAGAEVLGRMVDALLPVEEPLTISVKLPETRTLKDLEVLVRETHLALAHPADTLFGPCIELHGVDVGSTWLDLVVEAATIPRGAVVTPVSGVPRSLRNDVFGFLGGLVDLFGRVIRMRQKQLLVDVHLKMIEADPKALEEAGRRSELLIHKTIAEKVEEMVQVYGVEPERQAAAVVAGIQATKVGVLLLEKGAEIHARLSRVALEGATPAEVAEARRTWPDPNDIKRIVATPLERLDDEPTQSEEGKG